MSYGLDTDSIKLDVLYNLLGSKNQQTFDSILATLERRYSDPEAPWYAWYGDPEYPQSFHEVKKYWQKYLHRIIFEGKIYDHTDNKAAVFKKYDEYLGFPCEYALQDVLEAIFKTEPLPQPIYKGWSRHHKFVDTLEALEEAKLDPQALTYWRYLCEGRAFADGYTGGYNYYAYLSNVELGYMIAEIDKKYWDIPVSVKSILLSEANSDVDFFRKIVESGRDLFARTV